MTQIDSLQKSTSVSKQALPFTTSEQMRHWFRETQTKNSLPTLLNIVTNAIQQAREENPNVNLLEAILQLHDLSLPYYLQLRALLTQNAKLPKNQAVWAHQQATSYIRTLSAFYGIFLDSSIQNTLFSSIKSHLPTMLVRMMHNINQFVLWQFWQHEAPHSTIWHEVSRIYQQAEMLGIEAKNLPFFSEANHNSSVQDQFLLLILFTQLTSGNLNNRQLLSAYQIAQLLTPKIDIKKHFFTQASFYLDLDSGLPPSRPSGNFTNHAGLRFFSTHEITSILQDWSRLAEINRIPKTVSDQLSNHVDQSLFELLSHEWSGSAYLFPRAKREAVENISLELVMRLNDIYEELKLQDSTPPSLQDTLSKKTSDQIRVYGYVSTARREIISTANPDASLAKINHVDGMLNNQSLTGIGFSTDSQNYDHLNLGALIGFSSKEEQMHSWSIGIIRRILRLDDQTVFVGVETLSTRPVIATIKTISQPQLESQMTVERINKDGIPAVFVSYTKNGEAKRNTVLIAPAHYIPQKQSIMLSKGKKFSVSLGSLIEKGVDWCLCELVVHSVIP